MFSPFVAWVLAVSTCLGLLLVFAWELKSRRSAIYVRRNALFSRAERAFLEALDCAMGKECRVLGKVRIADLVCPHATLGEREWMKAFRAVSSKNVDFVLCDKDALSPICAIELDGPSHPNPDRCERDEFIEDVFKSAGLALVRFPARQQYSAEEVGVAVRHAVEEAKYAAPYPAPHHGHRFGTPTN